MIRRPLTSSNLSSAGWSAEEGLEVEFTNGQVYRYKDAPESVYRELIGATSPGKFFAANVRDQFEHEKV